jgi:hypothetical protein
VASNLMRVYLAILNVQDEMAVEVSEVSEVSEE